ncbi:dihydrolipoamide acetyltransferase family protein [Rathayibacter iranicus]|uniref:Dihydrolipoamide acetyltransferase component of pyruvate dehydrogenase complex n=2 Tax=Rathayibacter iranicus TaxID=59737 RepID=A0AAD1ADP2_9MICO|nr:dihydrolipoamide acetyltransferase family protein [Rathayibacter iranicus]AZZ56342.1 2-oxo acid dehydrogenase subunit E2 [Rathayibacter iranicus]MWV32169.1 2-oxo acid dehydrogenase subunit E2 [Rathayibacter iranicus NCPPB 2253 = VKM Ac-1602]PPI45545.1 branched-chain alpha-keto acid dehydrogenase subunit E2 [Rathayibacter iranicus]PPI59365.1 branched-chain alpha-keto acid dehydrogenase subunit E2 [Rathayibacter iranicus]PPI70447.1 branched-chain alpha-keto acid dehydrogenase subunit E2 [Rath
MTEQFLLPDVGEGLTEAEIVAWKVKVGDEVAVNQVLVEIETAKSLVELPSPFSGTVVDVLVNEGQTVDVGTAIISVQSGAGVVGSEVPAIPAHPAQATTPPAPSTSEPGEGSGAALVGYGAAGGQVATRRRRPGTVASAPIRPDAPVRPTSVPAAAALPIIAKPPIRKLAKDLDVNLLEVQATGLAGEVTRDDVIRHASQASVFRNIQTPAWGDDREERIPVRGVRKAIAAAMSTSAFTAPHVSVFVDVDATRTMEFVKRLKNSPDFAGVKVSPLLIMAKAIIWAVRRNPTVNSAWTDTDIIVRHYVNLGIAAATPRGLLVPNVKDAQSMSLLELAQALEKLTLDARDGKTTAADMQNGTITITNIGVFGMDTGTPILNPGEVAIIALGTIKQKPWVVDGEVRPRFVTTVGGSFDHRVVDGDVVSRFVADVASVLEEPALLLD